MPAHSRALLRRSHRHRCGRRRLSRSRSRFVWWKVPKQNGKCKFIHSSFYDCNSLVRNMHTYTLTRPARPPNQPPPPPPSPQFQDSAHPLTQFINLNIHRRCLSHRHCILHISNEDMYLARSVSSTCITELNDFYYLLRCLARSREQARFSSPSPERYGTWCI